MSSITNASDLQLLSEENVRLNVLKHYNLENSIVTQIKFKNTDKQRAVYKVSHGSKNYCLKKVYFPEEELLFVYSAIEWMHRYNIKVPRILPTLESNRFVNYENMLFILTPWIEGCKCDYDNPIHVTRSTENLSLMHHHSSKFFPILGSDNREKFDNVYDTTEKRFNQLLECSNLAFKYKDKFSKYFLSHFDANLNTAKNILTLSCTINHNNLQKNLCHLDYVNKNIILDNNNNVWVIDFDKCRIDYRVHDIGYFMRRYLRRDNTSWDVKKAIECIEIYEGINPLNLDEHKYILCYIGFPQKFWKISRDYYRNIKRCNKNSFFKVLTSSIEKEKEQDDFVIDFLKYIEDKFNIKLS